MMWRKSLFSDHIMEQTSNEDTMHNQVEEDSHTEKKGIDLRKDDFNAQQGHKYIQINIDMSIIKGNENFMEKLKLNLITSINNVICSTKTDDKDRTSAYYSNDIKMITEITTK
jgi:hypothetical protein